MEDQKASKLNENYKSTGPTNSTNPQHKKHEETPRHIKIESNQVGKKRIS